MTAARPMPDPANQQEWEAWRVLQEVLEERDREYWAEAPEEDEDE